MAHQNLELKTKMKTEKSPVLEMTEKKGKKRGKIETEKRKSQVATDPEREGDQGIVISQKKETESVTDPKKDHTSVLEMIEIKMKTGIEIEKETDEGQEIEKGIRLREGANLDGGVDLMQADQVGEKDRDLLGEINLEIVKQEGDQAQGQDEGGKAHIFSSEPFIQYSFCLNYSTFCSFLQSSI